MTVIGPVLTEYIDEHRADIRKGKYSDGSTALVLYADGELLSKASVCLADYGERPRDDDHVFIKDYSENAGILQALQDAGVIGEVLRTVECGWAVAHEVKIIREIDAL